MDNAALAVIGEGFTQLVEGVVSVPPRMRVDIRLHDGEVDLNMAYITGKHSFAINIASGFQKNCLQQMWSYSWVSLSMSVPVNW